MTNEGSQTYQMIHHSPCAALRPP